MAEILIPNIGLPKEGTSRIVIYPNGRVDIINSYNEACIGTDITAIELPPHGRLVTLDDVIELLGSGISLDTQADRDWAIELAERLPIIVEASNGSDN